MFFIDIDDLVKYVQEAKYLKYARYLKGYNQIKIQTSVGLESVYRNKLRLATKTARAHNKPKNCNSMFVSLPSLLIVWAGLI